MSWILESFNTWSTRSIRVVAFTFSSHDPQRLLSFWLLYVYGIPFQGIHFWYAFGSLWKRRYTRCFGLSLGTELNIKKYLNFSFIFSGMVRVFVFILVFTSKIGIMEEPTRNNIFYYYSESLTILFMILGVFHWSYNRG